MTVIVVGPSLLQRESLLQVALERAACEGVFVPNTAALKEALERRTPRCVIADGNDDLRALNRTIRQDAKCFGVPLVAVSEQLSERVFLELYQLGADDVVALSQIGDLTRRLATLKGFDPEARTALFQGSCLLAHSDTYRRQVMGRVLRQAGFDVSFAATASEALQVAERSPPKVLVVSEGLEGGGIRALSLLSQHWVGTMPAILLTNRAPSGSISTGGWPVVHEDAPPDDLLFVANELLKPREMLESRASKRVLYATLCTFRSAGELEPRMGLTYNMSREGLYIRTLDAPPPDRQVWIELRPIGVSGAVHLRAEIAWTRTLSTGARGSAPPGFAARILPLESPPSDHAAYVRQYDVLLRLTGFS